MLLTYIKWIVFWIGLNSKCKGWTQVIAQERGNGFFPFFDKMLPLDMFNHRPQPIKPGN